MKIVVIGGTGLIGSKTVERLRKKGHEVLAASPNSGVNTMPAVNDFAVSGVRSGLPRVTRRWPWLLPPVSRSWNPVELRPWG